MFVGLAIIVVECMIVLNLRKRPFITCQDVIYTHLRAATSRYVLIARATTVRTIVSASSSQVPRFPRCDASLCVRDIILALFK